MGHIMKEIRVGLLGFGTIGTGMVKWIQDNGELIAARTGITLTTTRIADLDITTDRGVSLPEGVLTTDANDVLHGDDVDVVVELVGGTGIALTFVLAALNAGKPVVTANKALLAYHGDEIFAAASANHVDVYYEASVGGGIPIIKAFREGLVANNVTAAYGILNGTCNYILTRMEREGAPFDQILSEAQALGFAEAEPSLDVDGDDTAHKACVLGSLACGKWLGMDSIAKQGIRDVTTDDISIALEAGYRIKLLGIIKQDKDGLQIRVQPTLVPIKSMIGGVMEVYNAVFVTGDAVGDTMFYGAGAGRDATASAVIADLVDVGLNLADGTARRTPPFCPYNDSVSLPPAADIVTRHYVRVHAEDQPNVMAQLTAAFGKAGIGLAEVIQHQTSGPSVPIVFMTHPAREGLVTETLEQISDLAAVTAPPVHFRIEDM